MYLNEIGLYASSVPQFLLNQDRLGQKTFSLAEKIVDILENRFNRMTDVQLRKNSSVQKNKYEKMQEINKKHAIEDAVDALFLIKNIFSDKEWDDIIECKGKIIQLMDNE